jgi:hypothetical protein
MSSPYTSVSIMNSENLCIRIRSTREFAPDLPVNSSVANNQDFDSIRLMENVRAGFCSDSENQYEIPCQ